MNTMQQEFDAVAAHLYKQGSPARQFDGTCLYRSGEMSCAVGCRIPDSMYDKRMEFNNLERLLEYQPSRGYQLPEEISTYEPMFTELQRVHDSWRTSDSGVYQIEHLDAGLAKVAKVFNLTFTKPQ